MRVRRRGIASARPPTLHGALDANATLIIVLVDAVDRAFTKDGNREDVRLRQAVPGDSEMF